MVVLGFPRGFQAVEGRKKLGREIWGSKIPTFWDDFLSCQGSKPSEETPGAKEENEIRPFVFFWGGGKGRKWSSAFVEKLLAVLFLVWLHVFCEMFNIRLIPIKGVQET